MTGSTDWTGRDLTVDVGPVAHGGHCVARHEGRVVFVRHALPGESVVARVTEDRGGSFCRADAVSVLVASPDRVAPPCPYAGPGLCGGCDWQHASLEAQRRLKAAVVREQLARLGGVTDDALLDVAVVGLPGGPAGLAGASDGALGWRTRMRYAVSDEGRLGFHAHRSHEVVPVERCLLATAAADATGVTRRSWGNAAEVAVAAPSAGDAVVAVRRPGEASGRWHVRSGPAVVAERAAGRVWRVGATGFWQVHMAAADVLAAAVVSALQPVPGERCLDLYAGVGLFSGPLGVAVGATGSVVAVEGDRRSASLAAENLADLPQARVVGRPVLDALTDRGGAVAGPADLVVLDPPRTGAGAKVVGGIARTGARRVAYVACDPASLGRDVALFARMGYALLAVTAYDLFPMTHHVECVATFVDEGA